MYREELCEKDPDGDSICNVNKTAPKATQCWEDSRANSDGSGTRNFHGPAQKDPQCWEQTRSKHLESDGICDDPVSKDPKYRAESCEKDPDGDSICNVNTSAPQAPKC